MADGSLEPTPLRGTARLRRCAGGAARDAGGGAPVDGARDRGHFTRRTEHGAAEEIGRLGVGGAT
ncbi:hypothetical protein [Sorangium cellulosum]|uniref:hypothetical protein n=1 Tax=Sorangium cellulosum TaxID=56 RepID=UPI001010A7E9|nr:hypothetical protein [Sorangium cellulosum]